jgi:hypothetical protein
MLYEVTNYVVCGPDIAGLFCRLKKRIGLRRLADDKLHAYDGESFVFNVACVGEDIRAGRISEPADEHGWEEAILAEFLANLATFMAAFSPGSAGTN